MTLGRDLKGAIARMPKDRKKSGDLTRRQKLDRNPKKFGRALKSPEDRTAKKSVAKTRIRRIPQAIGRCAPQADILSAGVMELRSCHFRMFRGEWSVDLGSFTDVEYE